MQIIDEGHDFLCDTLDGEETYKVRLTFVKRNQPPEKYPGNKDAYPGTIIQEVMRAVISRLKYVQKQKGCQYTLACLALARMMIWLLEVRAAGLHNRELGIPLSKIGNMSMGDGIEAVKTCPNCGHIGCEQKCH